MPRLEIFLGIVWGFAVTAPPSGAEIVSDWSEGDSAWTTQSYWLDHNILQAYTFTRNQGDRVAGEFSVQVHMQGSLSETEG